ncbi:hypothetical protein SNE40_014014 [Patella caerulea]|uniref:Uncharacterized protein n=1 Tax=Patella caerulea TaxID=87958 RepID=A0AAN8JG73_PATCE
MEQSPVKLTLCFLVFAVGTEAMNYLAFPRMGRSPRSVNDKSNGRYNGQAFAFPRGRRALGGDEMSLSNIHERGFPMPRKKGKGISTYQVQSGLEKSLLTETETVSPKLKRKKRSVLDLEMWDNFKDFYSQTETNKPHEILQNANSGSYKPRKRDNLNGVTAPMLIQLTNKLLLQIQNQTLNGFSFLDSRLGSLSNRDLLLSDIPGTSFTNIASIRQKPNFAGMFQPVSEGHNEYWKPEKKNNNKFPMPRIREPPNQSSNKRTNKFPIPRITELSSPKRSDRISNFVMPITKEHYWTQSLVKKSKFHMPRLTEQLKQSSSKRSKFHMPRVTETSSKVMGISNKSSSKRSKYHMPRMTAYFSKGSSSKRSKFHMPRLSANFPSSSFKFKRNKFHMPRLTEDTYQSSSKRSKFHMPRMTEDTSQSFSKRNKFRMPRITELSDQSSSKRSKFMMPRIIELPDQSSSTKRHFMMPRISTNNNMYSSHNTDQFEHQGSYKRSKFPMPRLTENFKRNLKNTFQKKSDTINQSKITEISSQTSSERVQKKNKFPMPRARLATDNDSNYSKRSKFFSIQNSINGSLIHLDSLSDQMKNHVINFFPKSGMTDLSRLIIESNESPSYIVSSTNDGYILMNETNGNGSFVLTDDGGGYLAFPRMGRSNNGNLDATDIHTDCCPKGIKTQWVVMGDSKPDVQSRCLPDAVCCDGLEELVGRSSEHVFFTKCVPKESDEKSSVLDRLLRKS